GTKDAITITNWNEAYELALNEENIVLFSMEKTPQREELFHWIGPLGDHTTSFYVRSDSDLELADIEAAKSLRGIATTKAWFTEQFLRERGFNNLVSTDLPADNILMVINGKAQATILTDLTAKDIIQAAGHSPEELKPILDVMKTEFYIAISKKTDIKLVKKWENAFLELSAEGSLARIKDTWFK
ncbi:MAG: transporter substrate-binding domain-containing protein, partial [Candidatus Cloacimonadaceae bacterium]|nr:transporter substrate-binding domain-containing protein [Candidatus Cloacimonadaceae bacterium]